MDRMDAGRGMSIDHHKAPLSAPLEETTRPGTTREEVDSIQALASFPCREDLEKKRYAVDDRRTLFWKVR